MTTAMRKWEQEMDKFKAEVERLRQELLTKAKEGFGEITRSIFEGNKRLESFSWRQYSPYFNDGDECVFSAHTDVDSLAIRVNLDAPLVASDEDDEEDEDDEDGREKPWYGETRFGKTGVTKKVEQTRYDYNKRTYVTETVDQPEYGYVPNPNYDAGLTATADMISAFLDKIGEETLEEMFGNHVEVTVSRDGSVEVDDYTSHD